MYQVLYRKWRPRVFEDVVGQEHVSSTLRNEITTGHIAHAYLFTGSRGTGKTSCAKIFSLAVNCQNPVDGSPCGKCEICSEAAKGDLLDVSEIDAASNNGIENIRTIKEETFLVPSVCKYRVYIIDEAHMLSNQAFNAFLKILEEPPKHVIFILATTEPHKIPATILSRCQRFEFRRIANDSMTERIKYICKQEDVGIDDEALKVIVDSADGAMRDALSLLDRCISCGGDNLTVQQVSDILGLTDKESIDMIFSSIKNRDADAALKMIDNLYKNSKSMIGMCEGLLEMFRREMIAEISKNNIDEKLDYVLKCADCLTESYKKIYSGENARLELEIAVTKMCYGLFGGGKPDKALTSEPDEEKECKRESRQENIKSESSGVKDTRSGKEKSVSAAEGSGGEGEKPKKFEQWSQIIEFINKSAKSRSLVLALKDSKAYESGDFILIDSDKSITFDLLRESANRNEMRDAIKSVTGKTYKLGPYRRKGDGCKKADHLDEFIDKVIKQGVRVDYE